MPTTQIPAAEVVVAEAAVDRGVPRTGFTFDRAAPYALFAATLVVYLLTLCPTVFSDDCGEIATAVATGGVMHPPGYPLYSLLGRLFVAAIPFGEPAWRLGLVSALAAAAAAGGCYRLTRIAGARPVWSVASAAAFAFSLTLWRQATKVETYALNALFVVLILLTAAQFERSGRRRDLLLFAACCGLALTNHPAAICAAVAGAWRVAARLRSSVAPVFRAVEAALVASAPLLLYGLVWWWAARDPGGQVWGDPDSVHRFLLQIGAARYRAYMGSMPLLDIAQRDLVFVPALLWRNMGWFLLAIVPGAARGLCGRETRGINAAIAVALALYAAETSLYGILNIFEYYTPVILLLCVWAGVGADAVLLGVGARLRGAAPYLPAVRTGLCAAVCLGALLGHWSICDRSHATYFRDLAEQTLESMPPHAVLIAVGDNRNFPLWYAQSVLGIRPDVAVVPRSMLGGFGTADGRAEMAWLLQEMHKRHPRLIPSAAAILTRCAEDPRFADREGPTWRIARMGLDLGRPVLLTDVLRGDVRTSAYTQPVFNRIGPGLTTQAYGLATLILPTSRRGDVAVRNRIDQSVVRRIRVEYMPGALMQDEPDGNIVNETYASMLRTAASLAYRARDSSLAMREMAAALALEPSATGYDRLGSMYEMTQAAPNAIAAFRAAAALAPGNVQYADDLRQAIAIARPTGPAGEQSSR